MTKSNIAEVRNKSCQIMKWINVKFKGYSMQYLLDLLHFVCSLWTSMDKWARGNMTLTYRCFLFIKKNKNTHFSYITSPNVYIIHKWNDMSVPTLSACSYFFNTKLHFTFTVHDWSRNLFPRKSEQTLGGMMQPPEH